jgi:uncharacterized membrane protein YuzA (DUF378 family)
MKRFISVIAYILVIVGALNWGLWGFFQFDFVAWLFGGNTIWISRIIYALIGLSGLWSLGYFGKCCSAMCSKPNEGSKKEGQ